MQKLRLSPEPGFSINDWTVVVIFMVVIGGIGTLEGPIIGMLIYFVLREFLAVVTRPQLWMQARRRSKP